MKNETPRHLTHETPSPTVLHHDHDETLLEQWLRRGIEKGPRFWLIAAGVLLAVAALAVIAGGLAAGESEAERAWAQLLLSEDVEDQLEVAEDHPETLAAGWALLQAAGARYQEGVAELPENRAAGLPLLQKAHDLYEQARAKAPADSPQRRLADLGMARALEARGDLDEAIRQYQVVAESYPETDEGRRAAARAELLKRPEVVAFYEEFAAIKPAPAPAAGSGNPLDALLNPGSTKAFELPAGHPSLDGPTVPAPSLLNPPAPGSTTIETPTTTPDSSPATPTTEPASPSTELPPVFEEETSEPAPAPEGASGELPSTPFAETPEG